MDDTVPMEQHGGWTVRRRWSDPERDGLASRFRQRFGRVRNPFRSTRNQTREASDLDLAAAEVAGGCLPRELGIALVVITFAVLLFLFLWELFLFAFLAALGELLLLVLLVIAGIIARLVFRHAWTIEARHVDGTRAFWHVRGWRRSRQFVAMAADRLSAGWMPDQIDESQIPTE